MFVRPFLGVGNQDRDQDQDHGYACGLDTVCGWGMEET
jgi:hypothetical protein